MKLKTEARRMKLVENFRTNFITDFTAWSIFRNTNARDL